MAFHLPYCLAGAEACCLDMAASHPFHYRIPEYLIRVCCSHYMAMATLDAVVMVVTTTTTVDCHHASAMAAIHLDNMSAT